MAGDTRRAFQGSKKRSLHLSVRVFIIRGTVLRYCRIEREKIMTGDLLKSLVFICRENPRRTGILLFADHPRFCRCIGYSPEVCRRFSRRRRPRRSRTKLRMIADHRKNLGRVGKIETLPILQICHSSSQTIGDIYDFCGNFTNFYESN